LSWLRQQAEEEGAEEEGEGGEEEEVEVEVGVGGKRLLECYNNID